MGTYLFNQASHRNPSHVDSIVRANMHDRRASIRTFPLSPASVMIHHVIGLRDHCVGIDPPSSTEEPMLRLALMVMLLMIPFGFSACDTAYIAAMDKMG